MEEEKTLTKNPPIIVKVNKENETDNDAKVSSIPLGLTTKAVWMQVSSNLKYKIRDF